MSTIDVRSEKSELRDYYKGVRNSINPEDKAIYDIKIARKILNLWAFREEDLILTYVSAKSEVDTKMIIKKALEDKKRVAVPRCIDGTSFMDFYLIDSLDDLEEGAFGILEPKPNEDKKINDFSSGLCIVPAIVFDKNGYRIGYGKGYYDRFLMDFKGKTAGLCYSCCLIDDLPYSKYDKTVDMIITQKQTICKN